MLGVSRQNLPEHITEGQPAESWLFLGWRIDRTLVVRHRSAKKHVFRYEVLPLSGPVRRPSYRLGSMAQAMSFILTSHGLAEVTCGACFAVHACKPSWLHGPARTMSTGDLKLGETRSRRKGKGRTRWHSIPQCPSCGHRSLTDLRLAVEASPIPLGGLLAVVRGGTAFLLRVAPDGSLSHEQIGPVEAGRAQLVSWRGHH
ncbi:hypothetical protein IHN63_00575 [Deinococcus sp. 6YEL10]|uniref:hypothetical protein n=1 Tax=Deinococcus sp. 6YEL10 TaxID=2745870 RepID=UPI001E32831C|nr:hypothetical protein [Deinococcus sp. 6YEL10]MCD0159794.1 hypothetical protein [Deinococcus sp. 6YEL10]